MIKKNDGEFTINGYRKEERKEPNRILKFSGFFFSFVFIYFSSLPNLRLFLHSISHCFTQYIVLISMSCFFVHIKSKQKKEKTNTKNLLIANQLNFKLKNT